MTDHKPLSDEDLRAYSSLVDGAHALDEVCLSADTARRLIAQSREANRLRACAQHAVGLIEHALPGIAQNVLCNALKGAEDPAARAKRELGEWLSSAPKRAFSEFAPEVMAPIGAPRRYNWTIKLTEQGTDMGIGDNPDRTQAILLALAKAKEAGR